MKQVCANQWCRQPFEITEGDLAFYEKISPVFNGKKELIPPPTMCPECRMRRRLVFRNERSLHKRTCDLCHQEMISIYPEKCPYVIYCPDCWWSDKWDPFDCGKDYDEKRGIFEQVQKLWHTIPLIGLNVLGNENCHYISYCGYSKHCYLSFNCDYSQDLLHCTNCNRCENCIDILNAENCVLCYESADIFRCRNIVHSQNCYDCSDSLFLTDCRNCRHCYGCMNLRNKEYCIFNEQKTKEEFNAKMMTILKNNSRMLNAESDANAYCLTQPKPTMHVHQSENVSGDYITQSHHAYFCFDVDQCEDIKYCGRLIATQDSQDWDYMGHGSSRCYELSSCADRIYGSYFSQNIWSGGSDLLYCILGSELKQCFGCVGLRHKQYCILNKQYTKEEYDALVPKIIAKMRTDGEYGEFFPVQMSPFAYNETVAQEYFPLTKAKVLQRKWSWKDQKDEIPKVEKIIPAAALPDSIEQIPDDILNWAVECEETKRPFRIVKQELEFYRKMHLPIPRFHPDERHRRRMALRNPRKLWLRKCAKCGEEMETTYQPSRPEIVYCEECYLKEVY